MEVKKFCAAAPTTGQHTDLPCRSPATGTMVLPDRQVSLALPPDAHTADADDFKISGSVLWRAAAIFHAFGLVDPDYHQIHQGDRPRLRPA